MATQPSRRHIATLRGVGRMAADATTGIADLAQALHARIARGPVRLGGPVVAGAVNGITDLVYGSVRGATRAVGNGLDALLRQLEPLLEELPDNGTGRAPLPAPNRTREAVLAALNGVLGDYLAQTGNPLAIPMSLRRQGVPLTLERDALRARIEPVAPKVVVLLHGLCMNDLQWGQPDADGPGHDHGAALERELGCTALYLHYNSGLHVSTNGRALAALLDSLVAAWPVELGQIVLVAHSMGGLVARSAVHYGAQAGCAWLPRLRAMAFLGTPHHGAPLERGGHWVDVLLRSTGYTAPFARLGRIRSAGITDLRHGSALDEDWQGHDRFAHGHDTRVPLPLPEQVPCYAIAATSASADDVAAASGGPTRCDDERLLQLPGDGLVPVASALGFHPDPRFALAFEPGRCWVAAGSGHLDLLRSAAVFERLRGWLA
ncbi:MAG: GPI inositol-deacylase [Burkholderiaceae bacterium]|nr:GPI inositol-deacylase [Burkholderiaceae bacterium]